ncbi:MAG: TetR/AcrR family transcriptional regulator [Synechococcaceae cyanobacterium SM2_3_1]|nr:TetR/AcrR family transcriptional regulator [Synechococcaceae cyanobacterium SM2_3_1]
MREVVRRVGVSHKAPYRHFADKEALLAAIADEGFRDLTQALQQAVDQANPDPQHRLAATGISHVNWGISHGTHYRVMFGASQGNLQAYPDLCRASDAAFQVLVTTITQGQEAQHSRTADPQTMATTAWSMVHGMVMLYLDGHLSEESALHLVQVGTQLLLGGLVQASPRDLSYGSEP